MSFNVFYAALDNSYANGKVGQFTGSGGTGAVVFTTPSGPYIDVPNAPDGSTNDPRLNAFISPATQPTQPSTQCVDLATRFSNLGTPSDPATVAHSILPANISGISAVPNTGTVTPVPSPGTGINIVVNPYAAQLFNNYVYFMDYDTGRIFAASAVTPGTNATPSTGASVTMTPIDPTTNAPTPVYTYVPAATPAGLQAYGIDLKVVGGKLYALFSQYVLNSANPANLTYQNSTIVRLVPVGGPAGGATLNAEATCDVGALNAVGMAVASNSSTNYLLVACIGGMQNAGSGNGTDSVIALVELTNFTLVGKPVNGSYQLSGLALDIKAVAATPPTTTGSPAGDSYVFIIASSYTSSWTTNFMVGQTTLSALISAATGSALTMGSLAPIDQNSNVVGYFWTVAFAAEGSGAAGTLIVGRGNGDPSTFTISDQLDFYAVADASGVNVPSQAIKDSSALYGGNCALNSITVVPPEGTAVTVSTLRSAMPAPVATGTTSLADFHGELRKKIGK